MYNVFFDADNVPQVLALEPNLKSSLGEAGCVDALSSALLATAPWSQVSCRNMNTC